MRGSAVSTTSFPSQFASGMPTPPRAPQITHDTTKFTFDLPSPSTALGALQNDLF